MYHKFLKKERPENHQISDVIIEKKSNLNQREKETTFNLLSTAKCKIPSINGVANLLQPLPTTLASRIKTFVIEHPI